MPDFSDEWVVIDSRLEGAQVGCYAQEMAEILANERKVLERHQQAIKAGIEAAQASRAENRLSDVEDALLAIRGRVCRLECDPRSRQTQTSIQWAQALEARFDRLERGFEWARGAQDCMANMASDVRHAKVEMSNLKSRLGEVEAKLGAKEVEVSLLKLTAQEQITLRRRMTVDAVKSMMPWLIGGSTVGGALMFLKWLVGLLLL